MGSLTDSPERTVRCAQAEPTDVRLSFSLSLYPSISPAHTTPHREHTPHHTHTPLSSAVPLEKPSSSKAEENEWVTLARSLTGYAQTVLQYALVPVIVYIGIASPFFFFFFFFANCLMSNCNIHELDTKHATAEFERIDPFVLMFEGVTSTDPQPELLAYEQLTFFFFIISKFCLFLFRWFAIAVSSAPSERGLFDHAPPPPPICKYRRVPSPVKKRRKATHQPTKTYVLRAMIQLGLSWIKPGLLARSDHDVPTQNRRPPVKNFKKKKISVHGRFLASTKLYAVGCLGS